MSYLSSFLVFLLLLLPISLHYRPVDALECYYCEAQGSNAQELCQNTPLKANCRDGAVCYIQRIESLGKVTAFERSCTYESQCATECLTNGVCTYCCDSDFCNSHKNDSRIPGTTFAFSSTDTVILIAGCAFALLILIVVATMFIRWQKRRSHLLRIRRSGGDGDFDLIGNDRHQLLGDERIGAGLPPTYDEAIEEPPAYRLKEEEEGEDKDSDCAPNASASACNEDLPGDEKEE